MIWCETINSISQADDFGFAPPHSSGKTVMVEFSSPNTNKPLHLGHIRNNILGFAVARVLEANGHKVFKVNLVNDRGIHICKSMLAWQKFAHGETPSSSGIKGDFLVGKYYVAFEQVYKKQVAELAAQGMSEEEARLKAPLIVDAQEMLRRWDAKDPEIYTLWERMNGWCTAGSIQPINRWVLSLTRFTTDRKHTIGQNSLCRKGWIREYSTNDPVGRYGSI